jgi:hypothetical protein
MNYRPFFQSFATPRTAVRVPPLLSITAIVDTNALDGLTQSDARPSPRASATTRPSEVGGAGATASLQRQFLVRGHLARRVVPEMNERCKIPFSQVAGANFQMLINRYQHRP